MRGHVRSPSLSSWYSTTSARQLPSGPDRPKYLAHSWEPGAVAAGTFRTRLRGRRPVPASVRACLYTAAVSFASTAASRSRFTSSLHLRPLARRALVASLSIAQDLAAARQVRKTTSQHVTDEMQHTSMCVLCFRPVGPNARVHLVGFKPHVAGSSLGLCAPHRHAHDLAPAADMTIRGVDRTPVVASTPDTQCQRRFVTGSAVAVPVSHVA